LHLPAVTTDTSACFRSSPLCLLFCQVSRTLYPSTPASHITIVVLPFFSATMFSRPYSQGDTYSEKEEHVHFLEQTPTHDGDCHQLSATRRSLRQGILAFAPWISTGFFILTTLLLLLKQGSCKTRFGSYEVGFETDMSMNISA
jgi:hypothetical protein